MKRILSFIFSIFLLVNVGFSRNFFSSRFFELNVDVPMGFSNNVFSFNDIFVKNLVIDLAQMADDVPEKGFTTIINMNPSVSANLNILGISAGAKFGMSAYAKINVSKDLFDFIGHGYKEGDELDISFSPVFDSFVYTELPVGFKISKFKINVTPGFFVPIAVLEDCDTSVFLQNDTNGNLVAKFNNKINLYASDLYDVFVNNGSMADVDLGRSLGFDIAGSFEMPLKEKLNLKVDTRIPIVPGRLYKKVTVENKFEVNTSLQDTANAKTDQVNSSTYTELEDPYTVNRPLKLHGYVIYKPFGFLDLTAGGGFGLRHPFGDGVHFYPEYYASAGVSLLNILSAKLSTEYTDEMFIHQIEGRINVRVLEIIGAVSLQSGTFLESFNARGFGARLGVSLGF